MPQIECIEAISLAKLKESTMTIEEQKLADDKMRAEINHLGAQTARINQQMRWQMPLYMVTFAGVLIAALKLL